MNRIKTDQLAGACGVGLGVVRAGAAGSGGAKHTVRSADRSLTVAALTRLTPFGGGDRSLTVAALIRRTPFGGGDRTLARAGLVGTVVACLVLCGASGCVTTGGTPGVNNNSANGNTTADDTAADGSTVNANDAGTNGAGVDSNGTGDVGTNGVDTGSNGVGGDDDNANDNPGASNDNANGAAGNDNDNASDGGTMNDNSGQPPVDVGLLATSPRSAFQSQCAQNVLECTTIWPEAVATLDLSRRGPDQAFSFMPGGTDFVVTGSDGDGSELVPLRGDQSTLGDGATVLTYSWSHAAADGNQCTLVPGPQFSTDPNPTQRMAAGFHYIRLTVTNDNVRDLTSNQCGLIAPSAPLFDFVEFEIEVRD